MLPFLLLFVALVQIVSVTASVQIDYYRDQYCKQHLISLPVTENFMGSCFKYEYSGAGSFAVNSCNVYGRGDGKTCRCTFHTDDNCFSSRSFTSTYLESSCGNTAYTLLEPKSVICYYTGL